MAKDIGDVLPTPEQLEGEKVDKSTLIDKKITVKDFVLLDSTYEGQDKFAVIQAEAGGKLVTFAGGKVLTSKLQNIGRDNLPVSAKLVKTNSKKGGKSYFDLVSAK